MNNRVRSLFAQRSRLVGSSRATIRRCLIGIGVTVGVVTLVACGSSKPRVTPILVLRGIPVTKFECPPRPVSPAASPTPIGAAQALLLCPLSMPGLSSKAVTVTASQPLFKALSAALSAADEPPTGSPCPAYADLPQFVLAKTRDRVYQVSIPTDACRHYQRGALDALNRARGR